MEDVNTNNNLRATQNENDPAPTPPAPVLRTGQIESEHAEDDGAEKKGVSWPSPRFVDNEDGTVTDTLTGLTWVKDINFTQSNSFAAVNFDNGKVTWRDALIFANDLRSYDYNLIDNSSSGEWRLPNIRELCSLSDYSQDNPALPEESFFTDLADNIRSDNYWTSTTVLTEADQTQKAWVVNLNDGSTSYVDKTELCYVWPVKGTRVESEDIYPVGMLRTGQKYDYTVGGNQVNADRTGQDGEYQMGVKPQTRFTVDDTTKGVTDTLTDLVWLKNANFIAGEGADGNDNNKDWWEMAFYFVSQLNEGENGLFADDNPANYTDWRVPNVRELQSLIDYGRAEVNNTQQKLDQFFDNLQVGYYWSSTTCFNDLVGEPGQEAWAVDLNSGLVTPHDYVKTNLYIWAVRGGYPPANFSTDEEENM